MKQNIRFRGLSFNKDEQSADHGELSLCAGVELHDGALRPSVLEGTKVQYEGTDSELTGTLLYVHETPSYRHYITQNDKTLYWYKEDGTEGTIIKTFSQADGDVISVNSVGNTLLVMTKNTGIHYILWKENNYKYLGTQIPFLPIQFRPTEQKKGKYDRSTVPNNNYEDEVSGAWRKLDMTASEVFRADNDNNKVYIDSSRQSAITEGVHAIINQTTNIIAKDGHFYAPFIIRYCYRLYDGTMVMHSAPVFMNVIHPQSFKVYAVNVDKMTKHNHADVDGEIRIKDGPFEITVNDGSAQFVFTIDGTVLLFEPNNVGIEYFISDSSLATNYSPSLGKLKDDWADIVKSVDFFVSAPIVREDMGELIKQMVVEPDTYGVRSDYLRKFETPLSIEIDNSTYDPRTEELISEDVAYYQNVFMFDIPMLSEDAYFQKICNTSNFYKIASYKLDDLRPGYVGGGLSFQTLEYDKSVIPNITVQEEMKDDYHTHNQLLPISQDSGMYVYNHRLNLYGMKEKLFEGFSIRNLSNYYSNNSYPGSRAPYINDITVEISTEEGKKYVNVDCGGYQLYEYAITKSFLFYPDSRATRMIIGLQNTDNKIVLKMEPLNFLNGAVATELFWKDDVNDFVQTVTLPTVSDIVPLPNRIITSEVDNPYYFPLEGRNAVGVGSVIGIAAVTRALSQGQVGDHDLVVFSTDGIWVLKVSSTGTYMSSHNISREVCSNPRSICQLDQSIIFATQRSLSKFVESDVASISDVLDGPIPALTTMLPGLNVSGNLATLLDFGTPAVELFNNGKVFYDYASSRIVVLQQNTSNPSVALVFSIRDLAWSSMMVPAIKSIIPGYPSPFVQQGDGTVMVLNKQYGYSGGTRHDGLIITRTLTFSDTMDIIRGFRQLTDSAQMPTLYFYGSNNQRDWKLIGKTAREFYEYMPGHPYRFFRVAIKMSLLPSEEYQQLELEIISKYAKL